MKRLLPLTLICLSAAAQDYRWIGTNLYNFNGCTGNPTYRVSGRVEHYYPDGIGKFKCPLAQVCTATNYGFRLDPQPRLYRGDEQENAKDVLEARHLVDSGTLNPSYYYGMLDPLVSRHIQPVKTNLYVVVVNVPTTHAGKSLTVYGVPNGLQPWHKADGTPVTLMTYDCGRAFKPEEEKLPAVIYGFTSQGIRRLTNGVPITAASH